jgi:NDP-sugar pyrophosphorylase family protein
MILKENPKREKFSEVYAAGGFVTGFGDFPKPLTSEEIPNPLMFTGIHILEPRVFDYIPRGVYSDIVPTFYNPAIQKGEKIAAHIATGKWFELSTIPRYLDISLAMMTRETVCKGENCRISPQASVTNSIIWDNVTVGAGAKLNRTILADGVVINPGEEFENAAIVRASMLENVEIPEKALKGFVKGSNFVVPFGQ